MVTSGNPFALSRTDYLTDKKLIDYFAAPPHIGLLQQVKPVLLKGGRGTGKTMLLRYLSFDVQKMKFLHDHECASWTPELAEEFWGQLNAFGAYIKLNGGDTNAFREGRISEPEWVDIFGHYFNMVVCGRIVSMLTSAIDDGLLTLSNDQMTNLTRPLCKLLSLPIPTELSPLLESIEDQRRAVERFLKLRSYKDITFDEKLTNPGEPIELLVQGIRKAIAWLNNSPVFILLDEYENLLEPQQRMVNTLVKLSSDHLSYKLSMRHYGFRTKETLIGTEKLEELHDYTEVIIERDLFENSDQLERLLFEISKRRLEDDPTFSAMGLTDIRKILHAVSEEEEADLVVGSGARSHIVKLREALMKRTGSEESADDWVPTLTGRGPLLDKLNHVLLDRGRSLPTIYEGYKDYLAGHTSNWYGKIYEHAKSALLFLLIRDYGRRRKLYCGFSVFARLSSGVIRSYLALCERAFYYAQLDDADVTVEGISPDYQTLAAQRVADKSFDEIADLAPEGQDIQAFVRELASVLREYHLDPTMRYPEVTFFSTYLEQVDEDVRNILHSALRHSIILHKRSMHTKEVDKPVPEDFLLNRIFAPKFGISTKFRNRVFLSPTDLKDLILGDQRTRSEIRNTVTKRRSEPSSNQLTFDF